MMRRTEGSPFFFPAPSAEEQVQRYDDDGCTSHRPSYSSAHDHLGALLEMSKAQLLEALILTCWKTDQVVEMVLRAYWTTT
jgi:hypothetical protein